MIVHELEQGSPEWKALRLGIPTASCFRRIITTKQLKYAAAAREYIHELLAEWAIGAPVDDISSGFMDRGREMEDEALAWYEFETDSDVDLVGFITDNNRTMGCSPDGLVGDAGGVEVRCPKITKHIGHALKPKTLMDAKWLQV